MHRSQESPERGVARRIKERREALGFSQAQLAAVLKDLTGVALDPSAITRLERGERSIRVDELVAIAFTLDVPVTDLLFSDADRALKDDLVRLVSLWSEADQRRTELRDEIAGIAAQLEPDGPNGASGEGWAGRYRDALAQAHRILKESS